jgi:hypothetical protein
MCEQQKKSESRDTNVDEKEKLGVWERKGRNGVAIRQQVNKT